MRNWTKKDEFPYNSSIRLGGQVRGKATRTRRASNPENDVTNMNVRHRTHPFFFQPAPFPFFLLMTVFNSELEYYFNSLLATSRIVMGKKYFFKNRFKKFQKSFGNFKTITQILKHLVQSFWNSKTPSQKKTFTIFEKVFFLFSKFKTVCTRLQFQNECICFQV